MHLSHRVHRNLSKYSETGKKPPKIITPRNLKNKFISKQYTKSTIDIERVHALNSQNKFEITDHTSTVFSKPEKVVDNLKNICQQILQKKEKIKLKAPDEISSILNKTLLETLTYKLYDIIQTSNSKTSGQPKASLINNIYIMLSMFLTLLKVFDLDDKILPFLFGSTGTKIDAMYKITLSLSSLVFIPISNNILRMKLEDDTYIDINRDPFEQRSAFFGGGIYSLEDLDIKQLHILYKNIYKNISVFIAFLSNEKFIS